MDHPDWALQLILDGRCQLCTMPCDGDFCCSQHWEMWIMGRIFAGVARQLRAAAVAAAPALDQLGATMRGLHSRFVEAGLVPERAPSDPMAAALHARRHRNTGPSVHADPRLNRRTSR